MALSDDDNTKRGKLTGAINVALGELNAADERLANTIEHQKTLIAEAEAERDRLDEYRKALLDARSQLGTAVTEAGKVYSTYQRLRGRLVALLPELDAPQLERQLGPDPTAQAALEVFGKKDDAAAE